MTSLEDLKQLAPTGKLCGGVVAAPVASAFFAVKDGKGDVRGVTVDLIRSFAAALKLPLAMQIYDNSGQVTDAVASGECDIAFMPQDAERAKRVDFGPAYYFIESTYLIPAGSTIKGIDEVNRPGLRIIAISNTTTARSARRTAPNAGVEEVQSVDRMVEMARQGQGDAFALSHELVHRAAAKASRRPRIAGKFPADRDCGRSAEGAAFCAEDCERAARSCEDFRFGASGS